MGQRRLVIEERYCGPPGSGNGGYVCGLVAGILGEPAEVTLRRPPPIGRPLLARRSMEGGISLVDEEQVVVEAFPTRVAVETPGPVSPQEAVQAARRFPGLDFHPFPNCFVCGPERAEGDGLRVFPGPVVGRQVFAAPWIPDPSLVGPDGLVRQEFLLGCARLPRSLRQWVPRAPDGARPLGRAAPGARPARRNVRRRRLVRRSRWSQALAGTAIFASDGTLVAVARAVWIRIVPAPLPRSP